MKDEMKIYLNQLKACYEKQFRDVLKQKDTYIDYKKNCQEERNQFVDNFKSGINKHNELHANIERDVKIRTEKLAERLNYYGWTDKQVKNIALNYNHDDLFKNVWVNDAMSDTFLTDIKPIPGTYGLYEKEMQQFKEYNAKKQEEFGKKITKDNFEEFYKDYKSYEPKKLTRDSRFDWLIYN